MSATDTMTPNADRHVGLASPDSLLGGSIEGAYAVLSRRFPSPAEVRLYESVSITRTAGSPVLARTCHLCLTLATSGGATFVGTDWPDVVRQARQGRAAR